MTTLAARFTDPVTSHEAAPSPPTVRETQARVLSILETYGPLTHDQIRAHYIHQHGRTTAQNVRSRTSELYKAGGVRAVDREGRTPSGRRATRWDVYREDS